EDVLYMLNGLGVETGIDLDQVARAGWAISDLLDRQPASKVSLALRAKTG
ncbi:MAG: hydroxymethylglutaryl-CoA lyase, partial [Alphaproteobacteria bacterium]